MARILASGGAGAGAAASAALRSSWLFGLCMVVVSVWVISFAVFLCGRSSGDDRPKKKPAPAPATKKPGATTKAKPASSGAARSGTVTDFTSMYTAAYFGGAAAATCGCSAGHGGGGCGGGGGSAGHGGGGCGGC